MALERHLRDDMDELLFRNRIKELYVRRLNHSAKFLKTLNFTAEEVVKFQDRIADIETRFSRLRAGRKK